jgi:hypothetical protein
VLIGHDAVLERTLPLPTAALFVGPRSVGKWTAAEHLRRAGHVAVGDVLRLHRLSVDDARSGVRFATSAAAGLDKLVIARLDDATPAALVVLLRALEESDPTVHFILVSENMPPDTITSRTVVQHFPLLTEQQVFEVLCLLKKNPAEARVLAARAGGQVSRALALAEQGEVKIGVLAVLRAFREHDPSVLDALAPKWSDQHTALLEAWCREQVTGRWRIFTQEESGMEGSKTALRILTAIRVQVRPRLVVRAQLMGALRAA